MTTAAPSSTSRAARTLWSARCWSSRIDADCAFGVIYFNNVGYLGMCGHGTIGLIASLKFAGRLSAGAFKIDTPVGAVAVELRADGRISVANVVSYRSQRRGRGRRAGIGRVVGDVAWGGNWFFLVSEHGQIIDLTRTWMR